MKDWVSGEEVNYQYRLLAAADLGVDDGSGVGFGDRIRRVREPDVAVGDEGVGADFDAELQRADEPHFDGRLRV